MVRSSVATALDQFAVLAEVVLGPWVVAVATGHIPTSSAALVYLFTFC